jgi:glucosamine--fructose-6-phosphate aminotransferase (isomerizing)
VERAPVHVEWDHRAAEKGGYPHFVIKEIHEQPEALRLALAGRIVDGRACLPEVASLDPRRFQRVVFAACGTSYYACMVMKYAFEAWLRRPVETVIASEFRYARPVLDESVLFVAVSQSGETADTLAALHLAREMGATTVVVTNVVGSAMTHGADAVLYMQVGPEIGVVATKTFTGQLAVLYLLGLHLAERLGTLDDAWLRRYCDELVALPGKVERALELKEQAARIASSCVNVDHLLFIGRGVGYPTALEGALKLKEISYIHAEGYPAGEMKHGPIALLEPNVPLLAVATKGVTYEKVLGNIQEARARDARVIAIATEGDEEITRFAEDVLFVPETEELLGPIVNVVPMQLLAYYAAVERGCDADQPRNLAKSVTVE